MTESPQRTSIRLPRSAYREAGSAWLLTISCHSRQPLLADQIFAGAVAAVLIETSDANGVSPDLYCLMPNHLHAIVQVATGDLVSAVQAFKSLSARFWIDWGGTGRIWQRSFHDHGLRTAKDFEGAVAYVFNNPVAAGLTERWEDYPLIGGPLAGRI